MTYLSINLISTSCTWFQLSAQFGANWHVLIQWTCWKLCICIIGSEIICDFKIKWVSTPQVCLWTHAKLQDTKFNYDFITSILSLYKCFVDPSGELVCRKLQKLFFILLQFDCFLLTSNWLLYLSKASLMVGKKIQFRAMACLVNKSHQWEPIWLSGSSVISKWSGCELSSIFCQDSDWRPTVYMYMYPLSNSILLWSNKRCALNKWSYGKLKMLWNQLSQFQVIKFIA